MAARIEVRYGQAISYAPVVAVLLILATVVAIGLAAPRSRPASVVRSDAAIWSVERATLADAFSHRLGAATHSMDSYRFVPRDGYTGRPAPQAAVSELIPRDGFTGRIQAPAQPAEVIPRDGYTGRQSR
jgi:hypothetical protein